MRTGFYSDPIFLRHDTGGHPENAGRLSAVTSRIAAVNLTEKLLPHEARPATEDEIALIHSVDYMRRVEESVQTGQGFLDTPDCILSQETYQVALNAAGALVDAVAEVAEGRLDNAFVACRPPGHHAERQNAMGFCFFNNVAIAASFLTAMMGYRRVLIFDFDVHHGNGTQHSFEERSDIFFSSIHQDPRTCFPGSGYAEERGHGAGAGYTLNVPMLPQSGDADYLDKFEHVLLPAFQAYHPDFVLISAGFDAHRDDPLARINLTQEGFDAMIAGMKTLALQTCGGKLVSVLEGGYNYQRLSECVVSHLEHLRREPT